MNQVEHHKQVAEKLNQIYKAKNKDYGDSFSQQYKEFGVLASIIRLQDKINRLKTLSNQEAEVTDESMMDTLLDLANYSIQTYMEMVEPVHEEQYKSVDYSKLSLKKQDIIDSLMYEVAELINVVRFYGNEQNYDHQYGLEVMKDKGANARRILTALNSHNSKSNAKKVLNSIRGIKGKSVGELTGAGATVNVSFINVASKKRAIEILRRYSIDAEIEQTNYLTYTLYILKQEDVTVVARVDK